MKAKKIILEFGLVWFCCLSGQVAKAQIPASRSVDWTHIGIPGGIPSASWPIAATLSPSGGADDSVAIQNAISAAPPGSVVLLNAGTYTLHRASIVCQGFADDYATGFAEAGLCLNKKVVLRGSGPNQTILRYGDGANIVSLGQLYLSSSNVVFIPITAGSTKGSTQITLQSVSGIGVGSYLVVTQTNPTDPADGIPLINTSGYTGSCSGCGHGLTNNVMSQIVKVTAVSGSVVTTERPLYFDYTTSPQVYKLPMVEYAGLENLRLQSTAPSGTLLQFKNINVMACGHCWVHGVESDMAVDKSHIYLSDVYGSEISDNYLNDAYNHNSGSDYAILLEFRASENLIQNNIIRKARHTFPLSGTSGNVLAYNYALDAYMGEYHNSLPETENHSAHPYMNLWEGNVFPNIEFDFTHGSGGYNTVFRNYVNLTSTNPDTGAPMTGALFAIAVAYYNNYDNILGNAIGQYPSGCTATSYQINANSSQSPSIYKLGYFDDGGTPTPNAALSAKVENTILRGGNWDCKTNSVVWNTNVPGGSLVSSYLAPQTLPNSLYLSTKPNWFTAGGAVWPPIDPSAATKVNKIPAQICYENGPKIGGAFNPSSCYSSVAPQPPTGLAAVVH
jgi:Pectate lyase superfamily protein